MATKPFIHHANDDSRGDASRFALLFSPALAHEAVERLEVAHLDRDGTLLRLFRSEPGASDSIALPMRRIVHDAIELGTAAWVIAHNHPSGDPSPSRADILMTRRFVDMGYAIDIRVFDHVIFAGRKRISFRDAGLI